MSRRSTLRASDQDREHVADRLRNAAAEGRLLAEELEERIGSVFSARTYGQLDALVTDLPAPREKRSKGQLLVRASFALAVVLAALVVVAVAAAVIVGLATSVLVWVFLMWLIWGRGRHRHGRGPARPLPTRGRPHLR
jgi:Flp pilus assembly protein TadB